MNPSLFVKETNALLKEFNLENAPEGVQTRFLSLLGENIFKRIGLRLVEILPEDALDEFAKVQESGDAAAIQAFLTEKVPNFEGLVQEESDAAKAGIKERLQQKSA